MVQWRVNLPKKISGISSTILDHQIYSSSSSTKK